jgi:DNA-binding beta-propeller fold protein YncE
MLIAANASVRSVFTVSNPVYQGASVMTRTPSRLLRLALSAALASAISAPLMAQTAAELEASGMENGSATSATPSQPAVRGAARGALIDTGVLLIPESTNDRVMAFDPFDGTLIDADFIPADPTNLSTPIEALLDSTQSLILVSDQLNDAIAAYNLDGSPAIGVFAPAGGVDTAILDNVRGFDIDPATGNLLVSNAGGANADAVAEFDPSGAYLGNRVANAAGGMDSPFDVFVEGSSIFAPSISSDAVHEYDAAGNYLGDLAPINTFPEQIAPRAGGGYFVANFSGTQEGIIELDAAGAVLNVFNPPSLGGYRGVYELGNGNLLITNGGGVHEIDRSGNLVETEIDAVSARFITFIQRGSQIPESVPVPTLGPIGLFVMTLVVVLLGGALFRRGS